MMNPCMKALRQQQPLINFQGINMVDGPFFRRKDNVVFVMGATGTGKSRLAIDLATRFPAEIVNSDKIQVYKGFDIVTNKVTPEECHGVPHHLLGTVDDTKQDFTAEEFQREAIKVVESIVERDRVPIIAGGSNSYIEGLVNGCVDFRLRYNCCFLWVDVAKPVLDSFVSERVDKMVEMGLVDEVRRVFDPSSSDYSAGIRRAIGFPELDEFLRAEMKNLPAETTERLLMTAVDKIKGNTCLLACRQLQKIQRLYKQWKWNMHRVDATEVFLRRGKEAEEAWENTVARPSVLAVERFLNYSVNHHLNGTDILLPEISAVPPLSTAVAAISRYDTRADFKLDDNAPLTSLRKENAGDKITVVAEEEDSADICGIKCWDLGGRLLNPELSANNIINHNNLVSVNQIGGANNFVTIKK